MKLSIDFDGLFWGLVALAVVIILLR